MATIFVKKRENTIFWGGQNLDLGKSAQDPGDVFSDLYGKSAQDPGDVFSDLDGKSVQDP